MKYLAVTKLETEGRVDCYIRNKLSYTRNNSFPNDIENVIFEILLLTTKQTTVEIVYQPPNPESETWYNQ